MATISRSEFFEYLIKTLPDNETGQISEADVRETFTTLADSALWHDEASTGPDGASAFEIAVANGFAGTEQDWLTSLVGLPGAAGPIGPQGPEGPAGPSGSDGVNVTGFRILDGPAYSVSASDDAQLLGFSDASGTAVTLPADATANLRVGAQIHLMQTAGTVEIVGASGVTVEHDKRMLPCTSGAFTTATAVKIGADQWYLCGALKPVVTIPVLTEGMPVTSTPGALNFCGEGVRVTSDRDGIVTLEVTTVDRGGALAGVDQVLASEYSLTTGDAGKLIEVISSDPVVVTLPADIEAALPVGAVVHIVQAGTGALTLTAGPGATARHSSGHNLTLTGQDSVATVVKSAADTWRVFGEFCVPHAFA